jgi:hypothetical protein
MRTNILNVAFEMSDAGPDLTAIELELAFARTAQTHSAGSTAPRSATGLPRQVSPHPSQSREAVLVLGQLDLESALFRASVLSKDVQNQGSPIQDLDVLPPKCLLDFTLLIRMQFLVKDQEIERELRPERDYFV